MDNKCPQCGSICGEFDAICSNCGYKFVPQNQDKLNSSMEEFAQDNNEITDEIDEDENQDDLDSNKIVQKINISDFKLNPHEKFHYKKVSLFEGPFFGLLVFLVISVVLVFMTTTFVLKRYNQNNQIMQYQNLIVNPAQIPMLKNPMNYNELVSNLTPINQFLVSYMQLSDEPVEKKERVLISYLTEMDKLPNILNRHFVDLYDGYCSDKQTKRGCSNKITDNVKHVGIQIFDDDRVVYMYPNYKYYKQRYSKLVSKDLYEYILLREKYNYPSSLGLELNTSPKRLADKIADIEKLYLKTKNDFVKEKLEYILYEDVRKFIFTPSIYATPTQEMKKEFKSAYKYYNKKYRTSALRPLFMSYLDKKRSYNDENFKKDYPYKIVSNVTFDDNVQSSSFDDVFSYLRRNAFDQNNNQYSISYVYNSQTQSWRDYNSNTEILKNEYLISRPDENNNVSVYNSSFSKVNDLNILKYSTMRLIEGQMYVFNNDKLSLYKITFNGRTFNLYHLSNSDVTSLFPGIEIINVDSLANYDVTFEKVNQNAFYIILSRYSQGWNNYRLSASVGEYNELIFPTMFSIDSESDVILNFKSTEQQEDRFSENTPQYKLTIHTIGQPSYEQTLSYPKYDEHTAKSEMNSNDHEANIMPKMEESKTVITDVLEPNQNLPSPPEENIEPPSDND